MANKKNRFYLYTEYESFTDDMTNEEAGELFKAILRYENGGEVESVSPEIKAAWSFIKRRLDNAQSAYDAACEAHRAAGEKGGRPNKTKQNQNNQNEPNENQNNQTKPKSEKPSPDTDTDTDTDIDIDKDIDKRYVGEQRKCNPFIPPSVEDVRAYCRERNNNIDAQHFVDWYSSKGWMIGKSKMKDWRASVRTWERREATGFSGSTRQRQSNIQGQDYDMDEIERILVKN